MNSPETGNSFQKEAIETAIKICLIGGLAVWTLFIIKPFFVPVIWGIILAVALNPFINKLAATFGGRKKLASILFAVVVIAVLIVPSVMLVNSSIDFVHSVAEGVENQTLSVPPPPSGIEEWPLVGPRLHSAWLKASSNFLAFLNQFAPQLKSAALSLLGSLGGGIKAVFMSIISIVIATALMTTAEQGTAGITRIITRFAGERGGEITALATATIRGVMLGVVGVAVIQAIMATLGMVVLGIPAAGLWGALVLVCAVAQLPPILVLGPVAAWVFSAYPPVPAIIFLVWSIVVSASDGVLKPVLMGRGVDIPMLVILIGALGGMMLSGIIGLFVGAVVVAISYTLFTAWVDENVEEGGATEVAESD